MNLRKWPGRRALLCFIFWQKVTFLGHQQFAPLLKSLCVKKDVILIETYVPSYRGQYSVFAYS